MAADLALRDSLSLVAGWLSRPVLALAAADASDPLRLDLPPLLGPGQPTSITASALRALAALYLDAELEQTGILIVTEALANARDQLQFIGTDVARRLDAVARARDRWDRARREAMFARLFGIGGGATRDAAAVNSDFVQVFSSLCLALTRYEQEDRLAGSPGAAREAQLRYSASAVLFNLAPRQSGITTIAAQEIHQQLQQALEILNDRSLLAQFRAQSVWDLLRVLLEGSTADNGRIVRRGQSGVQIFDWLASVMTALAGSATARLVPRGAAVFVSAAQWLEATGFTSLSATPAAAGMGRALAT